MKRINAAVGFLIFAILLLVINFNFNFNAYGYDLFGNDIGAVNVTNVDQCAAACNANSNCVAWTFVRAGLKGPGAVCFLKNPAPAPSFNSVCKTNADCLSGLKRSDGWCGESPSRNAPGSQSVLGQGVVLSCPSGKSCGPKFSQTCTGWWIFRTCTKTQTVDFFCQP